MKTDNTPQISKERRVFLQKASYVAPAIITMAAIPSFASAGSGYKKPNKSKKSKKSKKSNN